MMRRRFRAVALLMALVAAGVASTRFAQAGPDVTANIGRTAAILGEPNQGGFSIWLSALWPFEQYFAFGPSLFADDLGTEAERLTDPNDHTDLGAVAGLHRITYGGAWRLDAEWPTRGAWAPYASGTWGLCHVADDLLGETVDTWNSTGFSLGVGLRYLFHGATVGTSVRYHRLFNDQVGRYVGISLDGSWHLGK